MYLPSYHGDVKLTRKGEEQTELRAFLLTPPERQAMELLRKRAVRKGRLGGKPWASPDSFLPLLSEGYQSAAGVTVLLDAPILAVHAVLAPALRPERKLLCAERLADGRIEEISWQADPEALPETGPYRTPAPEPAAAPPTPPTKAATVARPTVGCPMPDFGQAEIRATAVLCEFLTPEQLRDYEREGCFLVTGIDSGHRYAVIHRNWATAFSEYGGRQLYDLDERAAKCIHDWEVPAPEEMLAILLHLRCPGQERYLRHLHDLEATA